MYLKAFEWRPSKTWIVEVNINDEYVETLNYDKFEEKYNNYYVRAIVETIENHMAIFVSKKKVEYGN